jgi:hypothetical protein
VWLGTFNTREEAVRAYDDAAWRFARLRHHMNFTEVRSLAEAENLAMQPHFVSEADARRHRQGQQRIAIAEADERFMEQWRRDHPEDVQAMRGFWEQKKAERRAVRAEKRQRKAAILEKYAKGEAWTLDENSERWLDIIKSTASEDTKSDSDIDWD